MAGAWVASLQGNGTLCLDTKTDSPHLRDFLGPVISPVTGALSVLETEHDREDDP